MNMMVLLKDVLRVRWLIVTICKYETNVKDAMA